jgi:hypothetical protein
VLPVEDLPLRWARDYIVLPLPAGVGRGKEMAFWREPAASEDVSNGKSSKEKRARKVVVGVVCRSSVVVFESSSGRGSDFRFLKVRFPKFLFALHIFVEFSLTSGPLVIYTYRTFTSRLLLPLYRAISPSSSPHLLKPRLLPSRPSALRDLSAAAPLSLPPRPLLALHATQPEQLRLLALESP